MPYSAKAIANYFIDIAKKNNQPIDQMKLQKLVYLTHGWNLAIIDKPLIIDDIQAWQYGPLIPALYSEFAHYGKSNITQYATDINIKSDLSFVFTHPQVDINDSHTTNLIHKIWDVYGHCSGPQLSNLTHMPDTPWDKSYKIAPRATINNDLIRDHFIFLAQN